MGLCCGMIGLPNVGKTTVFNALTGSGALAANYPFATVDPNTGIALVPDPRLGVLTDLFKSKKTTYSTLEVRDIAGLVEGASKGEGLGNQFLGHIREVDALLHVVRCFQGTDVVHVSGAVNPLRDIGIIETELLLADLDTLDRRKQKTEKKVRAGDKKAAFELAFIDKLSGLLDKGEWLGNLTYSPEERVVLDECQLLAAKPVLFVANVSEQAGADEAMVKAVREFADKRGARVAPSWTPICRGFHLLLKGGPIGLQLRASNEGLRRPRVARAKETNGLPFLSYTGRGASTLGLLGDRTRALELHIEPEVHDVGFFDDVIFAFEAEQSLLLHLRF
jgi:GTP-binding protein YchF